MTEYNEGDVEKALVEWLHLLPSNLLAAVKSTSEIKEPLKLQAVLEAIDDHYFTFEALNISETDLYNEDVTVCKKCYLKLYDALIQFHDNVINSSSQVKLNCLPPAQLPDQDIMWNKNSEQHEQEIEARKLGLLVVFVSLMCAQKTEFMKLFSKLPQESQYCLAFKLKPLLSGDDNSTKALRSLSEDSHENSINHIFQKFNDDAKQINDTDSMITQLVLERDNQKATIDQLSKEKSLVESKYEELLAKYSRVEEESIKLLKTKERTVKKELNDHIANLEDDLQDKRKSLFDKDIVIQKLNKQVEALSPLQEEVTKLRNELEDNKEEISRLRKIETVAERYRQKLETQQDMKLKLQILQEQNDNLNQLLDDEASESRNETTEATIKKIESERNELSQLKEQLEYKLNKREEEFEELNVSHRNLKRELEELKTVLSKYQASDSGVFDNDDDTSCLSHAETDGEYDKDYHLNKELEEAQRTINSLMVDVEKWKRIASSGGEGAATSVRPESVHTAADIRTLIDHYEILMKNEERDVSANSIRKSSSTAWDKSRPTSSSTTITMGTNWEEEAKKQEQQIRNLRTELVLMSSAWHSLASRIQQQSVAVMKRSVDHPRGWLNKQRLVLAKMPCPGGSNEGLDDVTKGKSLIVE